MEACKNCLHYEVCQMHYKQKCELTYETEREVRSAMHKAQKAVDIECDYYKDLSLFVELPCKAGTTVYTVSLKHGVVPWGVYAICSTVNEWDAAPKITLLARSKKIDKSAKFSANVVSTSVFLTREEAEQALKERESNG